jgi:hypothetical protein
MPDGLEKMLNSLKAEHENTTIPENIDEFISKGMVKYPPQRKVYQAARLVSAAAAIILLMLTVSIRFSPVFADYLQDVPVLKYIVKLVNYDKGLKAAVENNFIQNIGVSDEHDGIRFTVDNIIIDQARMVVFYTIENSSKYKYLDMSNVKFTDEAGKILEASYNYGFLDNDPNQSKIQNNIKVSFGEDTNIPDTIHLAVELRHRDDSNSTEGASLPYLWQVDIPIDKSKFANMKEVYPIDQTIEIEGQKVNIMQAIMYPTRIELQLQLPEENSKKILRYDSLKILDEKGEAFATISNDVSATMPDDNHINLYFESNYFSKPKELYLQINSVKALDKNKLEVIVDTDKKQMLKSPDEGLKLKGITTVNDETELSFILSTDPVLDNNISYFVFSSIIKDANNTEIHAPISSGGSINPNVNEEIVVIIPSGTKFTNPLRLTIEDYPTRIKGDFKIRIK